MSSTSLSVRRGVRAGGVIVALRALPVLAIGCSEGPSNVDERENVGRLSPEEGDVATDGARSTDDANRVAAATATAETNASCIAIAPFYWEIDDASGALVSGSVGSAAPVASTEMRIASSSKWLFGAYAVQKMGGVLAAGDVPFLNFTSGYAGLDSCVPSGTVDDCLTGAAGTQIATEVGKFNYNNGHLQKLAGLMGLGGHDNAALTTELTSQIGPEIDVEYTQPEPGTGIETSADQYLRFLRKLLVGSQSPLAIGSLLGDAAVCTNPTTCPTATFSPITGSATSPESWHYSLTHWVEDDPVVGDGAFSSGGAYGFYPWVDATRTLCGVVAREVPSTGHAGYDSAVCGRSIRKAWVTSVAQ